MASCWKCLKNASLGVSCSACCSTIVAADAAMRVLQMRELLCSTEACRGLGFCDRLVRLEADERRELQNSDERLSIA